MKFAHILLIFAFAAVVSGQSIEDTVKTFEKPKHYRVEYDKFKDQTVIATPSYAVKKANGKTNLGVGIAITAVFKGTDRTSLPEYFLTLVTMEDLRGPATAIFLIDGDRLTRPDGSVSYRMERGLGLGRPLEFRDVIFRIDQADVERIGNAKVVEFQIGRSEAVLTSDSLRTFREIASLYLKGKK